MVAERARHWYSPQEYLKLERQAETRSEYIDGCIVAMAGASPTHVQIVWNVVVALGPQLRNSTCRGFSTNLRVRIPATNRYTYPDVGIVCGEPEFDDLDSNTLLNPTVLIEVLSPSTETSDRGDKAAAYRRIPSLRAYVLIAQDQPRIEQYQRQDDGWLLTECTDLAASLPLPEINCTLTLRDVYQDVQFGAAPG